MMDSKSASDSSSPFDCILFDLDDTLYSSKRGIAQACKRNIEEFLVQKCGFAEEKASNLRVELFKTYGGTLAGLRALGYEIDADDYHGFVHGRLPYENIKPDLQLRNLLWSINQRKLIFTNSDGNHAVKVLERLGLDDCFDEVICFETLNPNLSKSSRLDEFPVVLKPSIEAMKIALEVANVDPLRLLFLDDNERNIAAGKAVGIRSVLVGKKEKSIERGCMMESVVHLREVIPEIWLSAMVATTTGRGGDHRICRIGSKIDSTLTITPVGKKILSGVVDTQCRIRRMESARNTYPGIYMCVGLMPADGCRDGRPTHWKGSKSPLLALNKYRCPGFQLFC